jgi:hypothetical protein
MTSSNALFVARGKGKRIFSILRKRKRMMMAFLKKGYDEFGLTENNL